MEPALSGRLQSPTEVQDRRCVIGHMGDSALALPREVLSFWVALGDSSQVTVPSMLSLLEEAKLSATIVFWRVTTPPVSRRHCIPSRSGGPGRGAESSTMSRSS